jgi:hypothetical protein
LRFRLINITFRINSCTGFTELLPRGYVNYYATEFSTVKEQFFKPDQFIRRRLRCMKKKRISNNDNSGIPNRYFERKELISLYSLAKIRQRTFKGSPYSGAMLKGWRRQTV